MIIRLLFLGSSEICLLRIRLLRGLCKVVYLSYLLFGFWQMTTAIAIEDVRREVKILRALTGHKNLVQFYEAYEDDDNVYVVME